jgi:hypothetical protein
LASLLINPLTLSAANCTVPAKPSPLHSRKLPDCRRMNSDSSQLRQQQQQQQEEQSAQSHAQQERQSALQFDSPEEMIRRDAAQTPPPASIAERLKESIAQEPAPPKSWWRRLFGGKSGV